MSTSAPHRETATTCGSPGSHRHMQGTLLSVKRLSVEDTDMRSRVASQGRAVLSGVPHKTQRPAARLARVLSSGRGGTLH